LEKMPALQDKLGELVTELQRIDARVAAAQAHVAALPSAPTVSSEPVAAPFKPAAKMTPIMDGPKPAPKPAPAPASVPALKIPPASAMPTKPVVEAPPVPAPVPASAPSATPAPAVKAPVATPAVAPQSTPATTPVPATAPTSMPAASAPKPATPTLLAVRVASDADKTRLVLDTSEKVTYQYDLDNLEKILMIDVATPAVSAVANAVLTNTPLIASYTAQSVPGGKTRLIVQLSQPIQVVNASVLPPNGDKGDRIVFDLAPFTP
jgi:hypothetical protein